VKNVIAQLKDKGAVSRGWIRCPDSAGNVGYRRQPWSEERRGALVAEPQANGPAAKAGIESGDIITAVNGQSIKDARELARTVGSLAPGSAVKLNVLHKEK